MFDDFDDFSDPMDALSDIEEWEREQVFQDREGCEYWERESENDPYDGETPIGIELGG